MGRNSLVVIVPQLRGDEEVLTLDDTLLDGAADTLTGLFAVGVVVGTVDLTVAELDGIVNGLSSLVDRNLPDSESDKGHFLRGWQRGVSGDRSTKPRKWPKAPFVDALTYIARVELDRCLSHIDCCCCF